MRRYLIPLTLTSLMGFLFQPAAMADTLEQFYKGKSVSLVVNTSPGGGYDVLARLVAKTVAKYIPGHPTVVVRNMPGAGGITATNYLYNGALKDGTVFGSVLNNTPFEPLPGTEQAKYDPTRFNWLGSPSFETGLLIVRNSLTVHTIDEARKQEITVASTGANSTPSFYARLLNSTLHLKLKIVTGYPGVNEAMLAMENGEVDGYPSIFYSSLMSTKPNWVRDGKIRVLVQYEPQRLDQLGGVPFAPDVATSTEDRQVMQASFASLALGRPYLMPPDVPADRVEAFQTALMETFRDPEFVAQAQLQQLVINDPRTGEQIQAIVQDAYRAPPAVLDRLRAIAQAR